MPTPTWSCLNQLSTPPIPEILLDLWLGLFTVGSMLLELLDSTISFPELITHVTQIEK